MRVIDFRSDTVTRPTPAMREAMLGAEVGDDVFGEDPTVNALEATAAERLGKQAGLFVPSGTMANQASLHALARPGDAVLCGENAHILRYESGGAAAISGLQLETLGSGGLFDAEDVLAAVPPNDPHRAPTTVVAVENTHNHSGGRVFPLEAIKGIAEAARSRGLALHMDGARLWNAVVATGIPAPTWAAPFDTVSFCLSKGLGCPVGSLIVSDAERVHRLRRIRKMLGGGMRQAGILAAAGLYALDQHVERLAEDHANARRLAEGLREVGFEVETPETNIVMIRVSQGSRFVAALVERGVRTIPFSETRVRAVTHLEVGRADVEEAIERARDALASL